MKEYKANIIYKDEYYKLEKKSTGWLLAFILQAIPMAGLTILILLYNTFCGGASCDGNSASYCSPSEFPLFYLFYFVWLAEIAAMLIVSVYYHGKAKENKIPLIQGDEQ